MKGDRFLSPSTLLPGADVCISIASVFLKQATPQRGPFMYFYIFKSKFFLRDFIYLFWWGEGEREGEEHQCSKRNIDQLPLACPQWGTWPATQACALTGN